MMINKKIVLLGLTLALLPVACKIKDIKMKEQQKELTENKIVVYQVFTRLFGNKNTNNKPWGTIEENGVGKFNDFTPLALQEIKALGVSYIWYTGVPHHAVIRDYTSIGV